MSNSKYLDKEALINSLQIAFERGYKAGYYTSEFGEDSLEINMERAWEEFKNRMLPDDEVF